MGRVQATSSGAHKPQINHMLVQVPDVCQSGGVLQTS